MDDRAKRFLVACIFGWVIVLWGYSQKDVPERVKQTDPAKERRVVTIIKWLWEKD